MIDATQLSHVDVVAGVDGPDNPTPEAIETFLGEHTAATGAVTLEL